MKKLIFIAVIAGFLMTSCQQNSPKKETEKAVTQDQKELLARAQMFFQPLPTEAPNPENLLSEAKVKLGKQLYFDTRLSKNGTQSCNTCHDLSNYGVDNLPTSPGDNGTLGTRNSPTVFNSALRTAQFWDGRNKDVEEQAGGPVLNPIEMGMHSEAEVESRLVEVPGYVSLFAEAFPEDQNPINYVNMRKAIGAFERTLITPSRFDSYLNGDAHALTNQEQNGLKLFIDQGCIACHMGPLLGGNMMQKMGLFGDYHEVIKAKLDDHGKFEETKVETDKGMFFVPGLRNVEKTAPYFHNGGIADIKESIKIMGRLQLGKEFTDEQINDMAQFFVALTGNIPDEVKQAPPAF